MESPLVSVLIAVRNEENCIISCLQSLSQLDYPPEKLEILLGNDASVDNSETLIKEFIQDKPNYHLYNIQETMGNARAKANVLAHLFQKANGRYCLITDADVQVSPDWIQSFLKAFEDKPKSPKGIIGGVALPIGNTLFHHFQTMEWAYQEGLIKLAALFNIPVSLIGNNMGLLKEAYQKTGGYGQLPFSLTEDFQLLHAVVGKAYGFGFLIDKEILVLTKPVDTLQEWLGQRNRWMHGARQLSWVFRLFFLFQANQLLLLGLLACYDLFDAAILGLTFLPRYVLTGWVLKKTKQTRFLKYLVCFDLYFLPLYFLLQFYVLFSNKIKWKNRSY